MSTWEKSGLDYCTAHNGVREEDERYCDFRGLGDPEFDCPSCDGLGYVERVDSDDPKEDCPDCEEGMTPCVLTPLWYEKVPDDG